MDEGAYSEVSYYKTYDIVYICMFLMKALSEAIMELTSSHFLEQNTPFLFKQ